MVKNSFNPDSYISSTDFLRVAKTYNISITTLDMLKLKVALDLPRTFRPRFLLPNIRGRLSKLNIDLLNCQKARSCKQKISGYNYSAGKRYYNEQESLKLIYNTIEEMVDDNGKKGRYIQLPSTMHNHPS